MEVYVADADAPEGRKVARSLLWDECLRFLRCLLFALLMRRDKLIFHEIKEG